MIVPMNFSNLYKIRILSSFYMGPLQIRCSIMASYAMAGDIGRGQHHVSCGQLDTADNLGRLSFPEKVTKDRVYPIQLVSGLKRISSSDKKTWKM